MIEAHASVEWAGLGVNLYVVDRSPSEVAEGRAILTQSGWRESPAPGLAVEPTVRISMDAAQQLFEEMWSQGFRSVHDSGGSDKLDAARKEHIEDLRKAAKLK